MKTKNYARISKGNDLELRIGTVWVEGHEFITLADFVPSLKQEGRGVALPSYLLDRLVEELTELQRQVGHGTRVMVGQQTLPGFENV